MFSSSVSRDLYRALPTLFSNLIFTRYKQRPVRLTTLQCIQRWKRYHALRATDKGRRFIVQEKEAHVHRLKSELRETLLDNPELVQLRVKNGFYIEESTRGNPRGANGRLKELSDGYPSNVAGYIGESSAAGIPRRVVKSTAELLGVKSQISEVPTENPTGVRSGVSRFEEPEMGESGDESSARNPTCVPGHFNGLPCKISASMEESEFCELGKESSTQKNPIREESQFNGMSPRNPTPVKCRAMMSEEHGLCEFGDESSPGNHAGVNNHFSEFSSGYPMTVKGKFNEITSGNNRNVNGGVRHLEGANVYKYGDELSDGNTMGAGGHFNESYSRARTGVEGGARHFEEPELCGFGDKISTGNPMGVESYFNRSSTRSIGLKGDHMEEPEFLNDSSTPNSIGMESFNQKPSAGMRRNEKGHFNELENVYPMTVKKHLNDIPSRNSRGLEGRARHLDKFEFCEFGHDSSIGISRSLEDHSIGLSTRSRRHVKGKAKHSEEQGLCEFGDESFTRNPLGMNGNMEDSCDFNPWDSNHGVKHVEESDSCEFDDQLSTGNLISMDDPFDASPTRNSSHAKRHTRHLEGRELCEFDDESFNGNPMGMTGYMEESSVESDDESFSGNPTGMSRYMDESSREFEDESFSGNPMGMIGGMEESSGEFEDESFSGNPMGMTGEMEESSGEFEDESFSGNPMGMTGVNGRGLNRHGRGMKEHVMMSESVEESYPKDVKGHIKALADRFVKEGAMDLWNADDGSFGSMPKVPPLKSKFREGRGGRKGRSRSEPKKLLTEFTHWYDLNDS